MPIFVVTMIHPEDKHLTVPLPDLIDSVQRPAPRKKTLRLQGADQDSVRQQAKMAYPEYEIWGVELDQRGQYAPRGQSTPSKYSRALSSS
jgi:hypothetical protein